MKIELAQATNSSISEYIRFADAKAGAVLGFATVVVGGLATAVSDVAPTLPSLPAAAKTISFVFFWGLMISSAFVFWHAVAALQPRTVKVEVSLSSFPDLATMTPTSLGKAFSDLDESDIVDHINKHNITLSRIAVAKYASVARSVFWLRLMLIFGFLTLVVVVLTRVGSLQ